MIGRVHSKETLTQELLRYVRFSSEDAARIVRFRERATPYFPKIARDFYDRIREHEAAHDVFTGEEQIARLQASMVRWLERLFGGVYDEAYFAQTERIGKVHVVVGLPQRYMVTAMSGIRTSLEQLARAHAPEESADLVDSLARLLDVELTVMLESYQRHLAERIERATDVERQALRLRAARAEHRYEGAVELARVIVVGIDRAGHVVLFNREAERVTGYARDEVLGLSFVEVLAPEDLRSTYAAAFDAASPEDATLPLLTRSKKIRYVTWQLARPEGGVDDDVVLFVIGQDVTEERAARQRQEQQERLAAVGTLAAGLAHEIRNPLNGAQLHISFLERALAKGGASSDAVEAVHVVRDEIRRLARLVTDFLDFARPRPLKLAPTTAQGVTERARQLVQSQAETANVELVLDIPDAEIPFEADAERLGQVLLNLLQNAIEAAGDEAAGGGHVVLRARREPRHVRIEVEDDGPGLPPGNAPVFDAFFSTKPTGTGLGLAIVHRIVTDHGGAVDVESRPGMTRFQVTLPLEH